MPLQGIRRMKISSMDMKHVFLSPVKGRVCDSILVCRIHYISWRETRLPFRYWGLSQELCPRPRTCPRKISPPPAGRPEIFFISPEPLYRDLGLRKIPSSHHLIYYKLCDLEKFRALPLCVGFGTYKNSELSPPYISSGTWKNSELSPL